MTTTLRKRNVLDLLETAPPSSTFLVRVDFNVPLNDSGDITDDSRIQGALPTIQAILKKEMKCILMSHMGRPKLVQSGEDHDNSQRQKMSLSQVVDRVQELTKVKVHFVDDCQGPKVQEAVKTLQAGEILILENLRFYKQEEKNDAEFAKSLASLADYYVNDAFGTSHRAHASVAGVPALLPPTQCAVGLLVEKEITYLDFTNLSSTDKVAAIIGGSKVSTKLPVIQGLLSQQVQTLVLVGGLSYTFTKALGVPIGSSLVEEGMIETAQQLLEQAKSLGKTIVLPVDAVCAQSFPSGPLNLEKDTQTVSVTPGSAGIPDGWMGLDVGPATTALFASALKDATKIVFNGPAGVFEIPPFDIGTRGLVDVLVDLTKHHGCLTVVGGGDSVAALEAFGQTQNVSYVSTGGGATLELLAGDKLPGVEAIGNV